MVEKLKERINRVVIWSFAIAFYILYYGVAIFGSLYDAIRIKIFGPSLDETLLQGIPQSKWGDYTFFSDGVSWRYRKGKWEIIPEAVGGVHFGCHVNPDGTQEHFEEFTDTKGIVHREEWKTDSQNRRIENGQ